MNRTLLPDELIICNIDAITLIQAVNRNIKRFPDDFMFLLTKEDLKNFFKNPIKSHFYGRSFSNF